jgi:hypothetical protein
MSLISEAFDALTPEERLQLLVDLQFEDPMRYAGWPEPDTRYFCLIYEVQSELGNCFHRGTWSADGRTVKAAAKPSSSSPRRDRELKKPADSAMRAAIAEGIKDFRITISTRS